MPPGTVIVRWTSAANGPPSDSRKLGYQIVGHRERGRLGEIDLVAVDGRTIVFVEVKTRRSTVAGRPDEAVDAGKQQRLTRLALAYFSHDLLECSARFDVVGVTCPAGARRPKIEHFRNAFEAVGRGQLFS